MIAQLRGTIVSILGNVIVIDANGVGYEVTVTPQTLSTLRVGNEATIAIRMIVREDAMILFGFSSTDERALFDRLQTVNGVGPKLALTILAATSAEALIAAISSGDEAALVRIPGVGKKSAARLILELGDKLVATSVAQSARWQSNVIDALVSLGWSTKDATAAVGRIDEKSIDVEDAGSALRAALALLDKSGRS
ncbi:MAG: Holliday junction branch migration protein RuvA [Actinomycetota bacterium]